MKSIALVTLGIIALALGAIGVILPIMPTTPFVLISAACFGGSNKKFYDKLRNAKYFGEFIENYKNKTGIAKSVKSKAIYFLWVSLIVSALIVKTPLVVGILLIVGILVTIHIEIIKTKNKLEF